LGSRLQQKDGADLTYVHPAVEPGAVPSGPENGEGTAPKTGSAERAGWLRFVSPGARPEVRSADPSEREGRSPRRPGSRWGGSHRPKRCDAGAAVSFPSPSRSKGDRRSS